MQRFVVLGINHKFAPLEVRERFAYSDRRLPAALKAFREILPCEEVVLLSTCNRVEVYSFTEAPEARNRMLQALATDQGLKSDFLQQYCYFHRGREAVEHLFRVSGGLDSLVLGETQILSQVKRAYLLAQSENCTGKALNGLFHRAFQTAKKLHHETGISEGQFSISSIAVGFVKRVFDDLGSKTALLIGAGEVGELTLTYLRDAGVGRVIVVSRTLERAREVAERFKGDAVPLDLLHDYLPSADIIISQTSAEGRVLSKADFVACQKKRGFAPVFALDLAVPRDIAEEAAEVDGVFLYNVDDLEQVVADHAMERSAELDVCRRIVASEADSFLAGFQAYAAGPMIAELRQKAASLQQAELERLNERLKDLPPEARDEIARFSERLVAKLLHPQFQTIRTEAAKGPDSLRRAAAMLGLDGAGEAAPESNPEQPAATDPSPKPLPPKA